jgi:hypothetical protein
MRRALVLVALFLAGASPAAAMTRVVDRGVVVQVRPFAILLRELDGTRERIVVTARTVIILDGRPARLSDLRPGDVVFVVHGRRLPARRIRAFSR